MAAPGFTNEGLTHLISTEFCGGTPVTLWFLGLINNSPNPATGFAPGDTLVSHAGWVEAAGGGAVYSGNRPGWGNGAASGQQTTNSSTVNFAITATVTVYGLFLCSVATGTSGVLAATAAFSTGPQAVSSSATLQTILTVSAATG